jgi:hypothetical protein
MKPRGLKFPSLKFRSLKFRSLKFSPWLIAALLALLTAATVLAMSVDREPPATQASSCSPNGATRWTTTNVCCACNRRLWKLQWCNNGTWDDTGVVDCWVKTACCAYPCCD